MGRGATGYLPRNTLKIMQKRNLPTNEVGTTPEMNLECAKLAGTFQMACWLFRQLEYANNRGTGEHQFDILEEHFNAKESIY